MIRTSSDRVAALCALMIALHAAAPAYADPSAADVTTAKSLVIEGRALRTKGKHSAARDRFKGAWALVPTPIIGMDLAREHEALGELVEAREIAIAVTKLPTNPKESDEGKAARTDAAKLANALVPRIPTLIVTVDPMPSGATVTLDGVEMPSATLGIPRKLNPGKHHVIVRSGPKERGKTVTLGEGDEKKITLDGTGLEDAKPATANTSTTTVSSPPAAGDSDAGRPTWAWVALGVAGAGAAIGAYGTVTAFSGASEYNGANATCSALPTGINDPRCVAGGGGDLRTRMDEGLSEKRSGLIFVGIGGAALVGGLVVFALAPTGAKTTTTGLTGVSVGMNGFTLSGRF